MAAHAGVLDDELRFHVPMYTAADAAKYLAIQRTTFFNWSRGPRPLVTCFDPGARRGPTVPFVGLAEGLVLAAFRTGVGRVSMQRLRPQIEALRQQVGLEHALASKRLYRLGPEIMYDYTKDPSVDPDLRRVVERDLVQMRDGQAVFADVVERYLILITYSESDEWATRVQLPGYEVAKIVADPNRRYGQPYFLHSGATLDEVLGRARGGEPADELADDYGLPEDEVAEAMARAGLSAA